MEQLMEEAAFISYHFHWSHDEVMALEHRDRRNWVAGISDLNERQAGE